MWLKRRGYPNDSGNLLALEASTAPLRERVEEARAHAALLWGEAQPLSLVIPRADGVLQFYEEELRGVAGDAAPQNGISTAPDRLCRAMALYLRVSHVELV